MKCVLEKVLFLKDLRNSKNFVYYQTSRRILKVFNKCLIFSSELFLVELRNSIGGWQIGYENDKASKAKLPSSWILPEAGVRRCSSK